MFLVLFILSIILSKSHDTVCPTAVTREQDTLCSSPDPQGFQLLLRPVRETFISVKKKAAFLLSSMRLLFMPSYKDPDSREFK